MSFVYVAQGEKILKIGRSVDPKRRLVGIKKEFAKYGDDVKQFAYFDAAEREHGAENRLIGKIAKTHLLYMGREWFHATDFEAATSLAKEACAEALEAPYWKSPKVTPKQRAQMEIDRKERLRLERERSEAYKIKHAKEVSRRRLVRLLRGIELCCIDMWENKGLEYSHA